MIRVIICLLLFYFGSALILASLAENIFTRANSMAIRERIKKVMTFCLLGLTLFLVGWSSWPSTNAINPPRYYIVERQGEVDGIKLNVLIKEKLSVDELAFIVNKIKSDSSQINYKEISFFLPTNNYGVRPYAHYNYLNDDMVWRKIANKWSNRPYGITLNADTKYSNR